MTGNVGQDEVPDRIEREVLIHAPLERVWPLVSEPGWWIGDGDPSSPRAVRRREDHVVVEFPPHGEFAVLTVDLDAPRYAAFRSCEGSGRPTEGTSTLVEFFLTEQGDDTLLRLVESGFAALHAEADRRAAVIADDIEGWETMLAVAKRFAERVSV